jgi:hypothetical protein
MLWFAHGIRRVLFAYIGMGNAEQGVSEKGLSLAILVAEEVRCRDHTSLRDNGDQSLSADVQNGAGQGL